MDKVWIMYITGHDGICPTQDTLERENEGFAIYITYARPKSSPGQLESHKLYQNTDKSKKSKGLNIDQIILSE